MGPTPFYGARAKKNPKADFAMKQTNICRLSGDIISSTKKKLKFKSNIKSGMQIQLHLVNKVFTIAFLFV